MRNALVTIAAAIAVAGCATVFEGTSQEITVNTNPAGASCVFERQGTVVANIPRTPAATMVRKTKYDLMIKCDKPGYEQASYLNHSGVTAAIAGNVAADVLLTAGLVQSRVEDLFRGRFPVLRQDQGRRLHLPGVCRQGRV